MFSELSREELRDLRKASTELTFEEGKTIMLKDKAMQYALVVISGIVRESYGQNFKVSRGVGNLLDALSIVSGN
jgi:signal-transduction protein with cAMP-binding, CBS, and nucleotidyltransferase domain